MQVVANDEACLGRKQRDVGGRTVLGEVAEARGHDHLVEIGIKCDEGIRVREACKLDLAVGEQLLDDGRVPRGEDDRCVDLAGAKLVVGRLRSKAKKLADLALDALPPQQLKGKRTGPAAFRADRHLAAAQRFKSGAAQLAPHE